MVLLIFVLHVEVDFTVLIGGCIHVYTPVHVHVHVCIHGSNGIIHVYIKPPSLQ